MRYIKIVFFSVISWAILLLVFKYYIFEESSLYIHRHAEPSNNDWMYLNLNNRTLTSNLTEINSVFSPEVYKAYFSPPVLANSRFLTLSNAGIEAFASKNEEYKELWQDEPYASRRKKLHERCSQFKIDKTIDLSRFVFDDRHKVVMCVVPKDACSTWKRHMLYLNGKVSNSSSIYDFSATDLILGLSKKIKTLAQIPRTEAIKKLLSFTTFFVTRNPFQRLVSAHSSKFTSRARTAQYKRNAGRAIAFHQAKFYLHGLQYTAYKNRTITLKRNQAFDRLTSSQQQSALRYINIMNTGEITFSQLLYHIASLKNPYDFDIHWRPQVNLCNPCALNYDFVVDFNNLVADSNKLLDYVQKTEPINRRTYFNESTPSLINFNRTKEAFSHVQSKSIINRLKSIYAQDFYLLGHSPDVIT